MTQLVTYSLEFRGYALPDGAAVVLRACAPSGSHETRLDDDGLAGRFLFEDGAEEAILESRLVFNSDDTFSAVTTVDFGHGHRLYAGTVAPGSLAFCADEHLRHGSAVFHVLGGTGQLEDATGRVTSNFVLSDTGDLTDNQLGMVFLSAPGVPSNTPRARHAAARRRGGSRG